MKIFKNIANVKSTVYFLVAYIRWKSISACDWPFFQNKKLSYVILMKIWVKLMGNYQKHNELMRNKVKKLKKMKTM